MTTSVRAVATSWRPATSEQADPQRAERANTPSPSSVLTPIRLAPAAPANEPLRDRMGDERRAAQHAKKPTRPATTATIVPTVQALTMNPENIVDSAPARAAAGTISAASVRVVAASPRRRTRPASR